MPLTREPPGWHAGRTTVKQLCTERWFAHGVALLLTAVAAACGSSEQVQVASPAVGRDALPAPRRSTPVPQPAVQGSLYGADEALRDVLSGDLEYVGTGRWPGIERSRACAFRNRRVLVVNAYCTLTETQAFRIDVYSPERGSIRIYAEAAAPLSRRRRADYFIFKAESGPPPSPAAHIPPLRLTMSYRELSRYEQQRYDGLLPGCFGGEQHRQKLGGCLGTLAPRAQQWVAENRPFLEHANDDWYRVIQQMRVLAARYGREQD